jgi:hypothetical protein
MKKVLIQQLASLLHDIQHRKQDAQAHSERCQTRNDIVMGAYWSGVQDTCAQIEREIQETCGGST